MRKSTWFWAEVYQVRPKTVEKCAAVLQIVGARNVLKDIYQKNYDTMALEGLSEESLAHIAPERRMADLDYSCRVPRRRLYLSLLVISAMLTFQPWWSIAWFSSVILVAVSILCVVEFFTNIGDGFAAMIRRIHAARKSAGDNSDQS